MLSFCCAKLFYTTFFGWERCSVGERDCGIESNQELLFKQAMSFTITIIWYFHLIFRPYMRIKHSLVILHPDIKYAKILLKHDLTNW